ncbi:MAG: membrane integrity-associated transporter subunit PqiC [Nitrospirota bacterium]|nr:MAG: membrane integrity-associated transporter subunit PqiC [Nitrospirota bacterium]
MPRTLMRSSFGFWVPGFVKKVCDASQGKPETRNLKLSAAPLVLLTRLMILALVVLLFQGCGVSEPIRYYQLSSLPGSNKQEGVEGDKRGTIIGIGPVDIPRYVDRLQIVMRSGPNVVDLAEFDRWAEPVQTDVKRVLVENVSHLLAGEQAAVIFWDEGLPLDYQVRIEVTRFDFESSGEAVLSARWNIIGKDERKPLILKTSRYAQKAPPDDLALMVGAMSRNLESLSQEISTALLALL